MIREEARHLSDILKAYSEDKDIEIVYKTGRTCTIIASNINHLLKQILGAYGNSFEVHIKPKPKYRPYNSSEEFLKAQKEHGMYLQSSEDTGQYLLPTFIGVSTVSFQDESQPTYEELLKEYAWQDGTPCGIIEE